MPAPYSLNSPQINSGGYSLPQDYNLMSSWGSQPGGSGGGGVRVAPISSVAQFSDAGTAPPPSLMDRFNGINWFDKTDANGAKTHGMALPALGVAQGAFNAWMAMKQYGLAKDQLAQGRQQFNLNYDAQRSTTNTELQDRQSARVASNPGAYQSVGDYMGANGIKPR